MSDENLPEAHGAFERLGDQAAGLDTMVARRSIEQRSRRRRQSLGAFAVACVAILAAVGAVALSREDPDQDVATDPTNSTTSMTSVPPSSSTTSIPPTSTTSVPPSIAPSGTLSIDEFLRQQKVGDNAVEVSGHLVNRGGSWVLCRSARFFQEVGHFCDPPWVMVTNYDRVVGAQVGPTLPPDEAALALAEADPDFTVDDGIVWTPEPTTLTLIAVDTDPLTRIRAAVSGWPTDAEPTADERDLAAAFDAIDGSDPIDVGPLRLAESGLQLGLSNDLMVTRTPDELTDPAAWTLEREMFRASSGSFSAVELLALPQATTALAGSHGHCVSPPMPVHPDLQGLRRLSIQPVDINSCLQWYTVDLYLDDAGDVVGITLDLYEP